MDYIQTDQEKQLIRSNQVPKQILYKSLDKTNPGIFHHLGRLICLLVPIDFSHFLYIELIKSSLIKD